MKTRDIQLAYQADVNRKAYWRGLFVSLFWGAIIILAAWVSAGCSSTLYSPASGKPILRMQSDLLNVSYTGGGVTFHADRISNSVPTRAALLGANKITGTVVSGAVGVLVPGTGTVPALERTVITATPHLLSPVSKPGD